MRCLFGGLVLGLFGATACSPAPLESTSGIVIDLEPIRGFTSVRHSFAPAEDVIPLPLGARAVLQVARGELQWSGATPIGAGRAEFVADRPGRHVVEVATGEERRRVVVHVLPSRAKDVQIRWVGDPQPATHVGGELVCRAEVQPRALARYIEWSTPGLSPSMATGPVYRGHRSASTRVLRGGDAGFAGSNGGAGFGGPQVKVRIGTKSVPGPIAPIFYSVKWVTKPSKSDYYQATATIRLFHEIRTEPAGFEHRVVWSYDTTGTAIASATRGVGRTFTVVRINNRQHPLLCYRVMAGDAVDESDDINRLLDTPLHGREDVPPNNRECGPPDPAAHSLPITLSNGEVSFTEVDLRVPSRGMDFVWQRTYSSRANFRGAHGYNWSISYNRRVFRIAGTNSVSVADGGRREDVYQGATGGVFVSPAGFYNALRRLGDGTYVQRERDGTTYRYGRSGYLTSITDRTGQNTMSFLRNSQGNIVEIVDTQGRAYRLRYTTIGGNQFIESLTDFKGRRLEYSYNVQFDLVSARSPIVTGTPNGNDFPQGKTTRYTYTAQQADNRLNHNLLTISKPAFSGAAMVTLSYSNTTDPTNVLFDKVVAERWGNDRGGPPGNRRLIVGGTTRLAYTRALSGDPQAPSAAVLRVTQTSRNGNISQHYFDTSSHEIRRVERTNRGVRPGEGDYVTDYTYTPEGLLESIRHPRGNRTRFAYDVDNPLREAQSNRLEVRQQVGAVGGGAVDLVRRFTYEPVFHQLRSVTDARAFPTGVVPLNANGQLDLQNALVARYTSVRLFDYQEGSGFQAANNVPAIERIPEGLGDLNGAPDFDAGNLVRLDHPTIQTSGPNQGQVVREVRTWNAHGQLLTSVDPEGHVTRFEYFPSTGGARDPSDLEGYLKSRTVDANGFALKTEYGYDTAGNVTAVIDPKGQRTDFDVNALNQVVRVRSRTLGSVRYVTSNYYDANDNLQRTETLNLDGSGAAYPNGLLVTSYEHDILNNVVSISREKTRNDGSAGGFVKTEYLYDAQTNRIAVKSPDPGGSRRQKIVTVQYDERELPYKSITGDNNTDPYDTPPNDAVVVTTNYDPNRNALEVIDSIAQSVRGGPAPRFPATASGDVQQSTYDGFDRRVRTVDPEGNIREFGHDRASNVTRTSVRGPRTHQSTSAVALLAERTTVHDELNRAVRTTALHVDELGGAVGDGASVTTFRYDREGKLVETLDDRGNRVATVFDSADRVQKRTDALGNDVEYQYDANGNVLHATVTDRSTNTGSGVDVYRASMVYDALDRVVRRTDPSGDVHTFQYDARGNVVRTSDGVRDGAADGNVVRLDFDGLDRLVETRRLLTANGRGSGSPSGQIVTRRTWTDDSLLATVTDANNHRTSYGYDNLGRRVRTTYADGTARNLSYNRDDQIAAWVDQNGTTCTNTFDGLSRQTRRSLVLAAGVLGTTVETFGYDGLSRTTRIQNDDIFGPALMTCQFRYDSLSNPTIDQQENRLVRSTYDGVGNRVACSYPDRFGGAGRRVFAAVFDPLDRQRSLDDNDGRIQTWNYKGSSRLERHLLGATASPATRTDYGYDSEPRLILLDHRSGGGSTLTGYHYGYDRGDHRLFEKRLHDANRGDVYRYDSIYRVVRNEQNVDLSAVAPGTRIRPENFPSPDHLAYTFDGVGNRTQSIASAAGTPTTTAYTQIAGGVLRDAEVNQYSTVQVGTASANTLRYDANGNLLEDGQFRYGYDFKNRLVEVRNASGASIVAQYSYDVLGRRARKVVDPGGTPVTTSYVYDGEQCVEERDGAGALVRQYVWGVGVDDLTQIRTATQTYYVHGNATDSVGALVDPSGLVVERYAYDPFGKTRVVLNGSTGNEYRFHGARFDPETGLYWMRSRHYSPSLGRFIQRDPIGMWTDPGNLGNGFAFVGNDAINGRDPTGEIDWEWWGYYADALGNEFKKDGQAIAHAVTHPGETINGIKCGVKNAWDRAMRRGELVMGQGGSIGDGLLQVFGSLGGDAIGVNDFYQAGAGYDLDEFVRSGNINQLSEMDRWNLLASGLGKVGDLMLTGAGAGLRAGRGLDGASDMISASGRPIDIALDGAPLSSRQQRLLDQMNGFGAEALVRKRDVSLRDIAALTAHTGDEFAMFTAGGRRKIVRGDSVSVPINTQDASRMASQGWRWSGHTHPGRSGSILNASPGDMNVLRAFGQQNSVILNSVGQHQVFSWDMSGWLPR